MAGYIPAASPPTVRTVDGSRIVMPSAQDASAGQALMVTGFTDEGEAVIEWSSPSGADLVGYVIEWEGGPATDTDSVTIAVQDEEYLGIQKTAQLRNLDGVALMPEDDPNVSAVWGRPRRAGLWNLTVSASLSGLPAGEVSLSVSIYGRTRAQLRTMQTLNSPPAQEPWSISLSGLVPVWETSYLHSNRTYALAKPIGADIESLTVTLHFLGGGYRSFNGWGDGFDGRDGQIL